jgi:thiamine pyrophosphokinase
VIAADRRRRALVVAHGETTSRAALDDAWPGWEDDAELVVAADGGAALAEALGLRIDRWIGDGDSVDPELLARLRARGVSVDVVAAEKDESDTELALLAALEAGATEIVVLGAVGGPRLDHTLANVGLLAHPALVGRSAWLVSERARLSVIRAPAVDGAAVVHDLAGRTGDVVTLLPLGGPVEGVVTHGLRYALRDEPLLVGPARGLSNVRDDPAATLSVRRGLLLVCEVPATLAR